MANESLESEDHNAALECMITESVQRRDEACYRVNPMYLITMQPQIQWHMRVMLIDWMQEVCDEFSLLRETFHLAVTYTDLYLSRKICPID